MGSRHKTHYVHSPLFSPRLLHGIESLRSFVPYTLTHNYCPFHWYLSLTLPFQQISIPSLEQNLNLCLRLPIYITIPATFWFSIYPLILPHSAQLSSNKASLYQTASESRSMCYEVIPRYDFCGHNGRTTHKCCSYPILCDQWHPHTEVIQDFCPKCQLKGTCARIAIGLYRKAFKCRAQL